MLVINEAKAKKDIVNISALAKVIWAEHFTSIIGAEQVDYMVERFQSETAIENMITKEGYRYYMAILDGEFVGYTGVHEDENGVLISKLYIHEKSRGKGVATSLFNHVKSEYKHIKRFWLTVNRHNSGAISAYKKLGFVIEREQVADIGNGFVMDDYIMEYMTNA